MWVPDKHCGLQMDKEQSFDTHFNSLEYEWNHLRSLILQFGISFLCLKKSPI